MAGWLGRPDYYDDFRCIAGACGDSCCIGWEIDVDENKRERYRAVPGELGERLKRCIDWQAGYFILQGKEERCPFLNQENLCDLIIGLGEDALCGICREHPRFYDWFDEYTEVGLGLCCEAAGRLILGKKEPVQLIMEKKEPVQLIMDRCEEEGSEAVRFDIDYDKLNLSEEEEALFKVRDLAFAILQNRDQSIWERLEIFLGFVEKLQGIFDMGGLDEPKKLQEAAEKAAEEVRQEMAEKILGAAAQAKSGNRGTSCQKAAIHKESAERAAAYAGVLSVCRQLEPIDESWPRILDELEELTRQPEQLAELEEAMLEAAGEREYEYEQLAIYFVYRYFMKCREDEDIRSRGKLAVFCICLIRLLDVAGFARTGELTTEDRVQNAKCCSKEIEYSEENLEILADACWEQDELSLERLILLLNTGNTGYCKK